MKDYNISSDQLDYEIKEEDVTYLAEHFDNVERYVVVMGLTESEQADVKRMTHTHDNQIAMARCLLLWRQHNPSTATLRKLLEVLLNLKKERIASNVLDWCVQNTLSSK